MNNLIFVGGIHGAGKNIACDRISKDLNLKHLSASLLLQWYDENPKHIKEVENVYLNQNRLIKALKRTLKPNNFYILDGHFCLLDRSRKIACISLEFFKAISPIIIILVVSSPLLMKERLRIRDAIDYDIAFLKDFQQHELEHANYIAHALNVELLIIEVNDDYTSIEQNIIDAMNKIKSKKP